MRIQQRLWTPDQQWNDSTGWTLGDDAQLVLAFGGRRLLSDGALMKQVEAAHRNATVVGCSTAGEIHDTRVLEESLSVTAIHFDDTRLRIAEAQLADAADSFAAGEKLAAQLAGDDLAHVFVVSDGLRVNGSELVKGLADHLPEHVAVTGGLSGDGARFEQTCVYLHGSTAPGRIAAIGMYGRKLRVGYGSLGGWDQFGPERRVTRSKGNVLYELDGESALALYKRYLGDYAKDLPASGLLFPLSMRNPDRDTPIVRTILSVSEPDQSLTFAGDVPEGAYVRLMRANFDRLVDGATQAAKRSQLVLGEDSAELAVLISCVGRKLVLQQRTEEEVESVRQVLGDRPAMTGFYSYGEISPLAATTRCELHNQTMTITVFSEAA